MNRADVEEALKGLRTGLQQDGADINVQSVNKDRIELNLIFREETCLECIVNSEILAAQVKMALTKIFADVPKVILNDPRTK